MALMNPTITAFDTNRSTDPSRSSPATSITTPVSTDKREQRLSRVVGRVDRGHVGHDHRHRAGALDRHEHRAVAAAPAIVPTR